jgi:hypothetical protein
MCFFILSPGVAKSAAAEKAPLTPYVPQGRAGSNPAPDATLISSLPQALKEEFLAIEALQVDFGLVLRRPIETARLTRS